MNLQAIIVHLPLLFHIIVLSWSSRHWNHLENYSICPGSSCQSGIEHRELYHRGKKKTNKNSPTNFASLLVRRRTTSSVQTIASCSLGEKHCGFGAFWQSEMNYPKDMVSLVLPNEHTRWAAVYVCLSHSHIWLFVTAWTVTCQALLSVELSRQECWSGLQLLFPGGLPQPRDRTGVSHFSGRFFSVWATRESQSGFTSSYFLLPPQLLSPLIHICLQ